MNILFVSKDSRLRERLVPTLSRVAPAARVWPARNAAEAASMVGRGPGLDALLVDLGVPGDEGGKTVAALRAAVPAVPLIVLADARRRKEIALAIEQGASGFIAKSAGQEAMLASLCTALSGVPAAAQTKAAPAHPHPPVAAGGEIAVDLASLPLTPRQQEVLRLIVEGKSNKHIARELGIEESTVKVHVRPIFKVLNVRSRVQAVLAVGRIGVGEHRPLN